MTPRRPSRRRSRATAKRARSSPPRRAAAPEEASLLDEATALRDAHPETSPRLTGGDVDADWVSAYAAGDEAVGGSTTTPDQDVVDELGEALGVPQAPDAEVRAAADILAERDSHRWAIEREVEREAREREARERE
jgi:hypothetical protein